MPRQPEKATGRPSGRPDSRPQPEPSSPRSSTALTVPLVSRITAGAAACSVTDLPDYIACRITVDSSSGCWKVGGNLDKNGYARIGGEGAHRVVYKLLAGPIAEGLVLDHVEAWGCIWRCCAWPAHLEPVTPRINTLRGTSFSAVNAAKTKCDHGHPFDLFNTYYRPDGHRDCRTCIRRRVAEYQQRQREAALELRLAA